MDQFGQLIDFRLTAKRNANVARAFMRQAEETVRPHHPLTILTDKTQSYAKVIGEINARLGPEDVVRHVDRKYLNNRIEPFRTIRKGQFENCEMEVANELDFVAKLFPEAA